LKHLVGIPPAGIVLLSREGFKHLFGIAPAGIVLLSREGFKYLVGIPPNRGEEGLEPELKGLSSPGTAYRRKCRVPEASSVISEGRKAWSAS
jgi:hypothetical protein